MGGQAVAVITGIICVPYFASIPLNWLFFGNFEWVWSFGNILVALLFWGNIALSFVMSYYTLPKEEENLVLGIPAYTAVVVGLALTIAGLAYRPVAIKAVLLTEILNTAVLAALYIQYAMYTRIGVSKKNFRSDIHWNIHYSGYLLTILHILKKEPCIRAWLFF